MSLEGQQLGEFEILERLGQGGMGAVYKARQISLDRFVALKTLQTSLADDAEYIARFQQEARAAAVLNHPNLVQVYSAGQSEGLHWFAMEYVEGESAKVRLQRKGRLDPLEAMAITIHVATALEYGWRKAQLIHRDIKPDNIFLSSEGEVKLGDLGLAKSAGQTQGLTITGTSMGTPHYISPEQVMAMKEVDLRADIYSLGCTLYHLLSGRPPFEGNSAVAIMMKHVSGPAPDLRTAWPECPEASGVVVGKMMQKEPERRQQNYAELISDLRRAYDAMSGGSVSFIAAESQQKLPSQGPSAVSSPVSPAPAKSKWPLYGGIAAGLAVIFVGGILFVKSMHHPAAQDAPLPGGVRTDWTKAVDLVPLIAPDDALAGTWSVKDGVLVSDAFPNARVEIPYQPPEEYDYRMVFIYREIAMPMKSGQVEQYLSKELHPFRWVMGADSGDYSALEIIDGKNARSDANPTWIRRSPIIAAGMRHTSIVEVRNDGVKAYLDGQLAAEWKTNFNDMSAHSNWALRDRKLLGVGSYQTAVRIEKLDVYEVTGKGRVTRPVESKITR